MTKCPKCDADRSYRRLTLKDLERLAAIARHDRADFFHRRPDWRKLYANRIICVALCQGAALHFLDGRTGIKDFDVWSFYRAGRKPFPYRKLKRWDFGRSRFGRFPKGPPGFEGRPVDCLGRSIAAKDGECPVTAVQRYLQERRTGSANLLGKKAVVMLEPSELRGRVIWIRGEPA